MNQCEVSASFTGRERHPQRIEHEVGEYVHGELPADDLPAERVDHKREEHDALVLAQIREVREPQVVRPEGREIAIDQRLQGVLSWVSQTGTACATASVAYRGS